MVAGAHIDRGVALLDDEITLPIEMLSDVSNHSAWRRFMAERIASSIDHEEYGVRDVYLIGSAETGEAGIDSDIDLVIHLVENPDKQRRLFYWLDGWSRSLALVNYMRTGYMTEGLLDVHLVTDRGIRECESYTSQMHNFAPSTRLTNRS